MVICDQKYNSLKELVIFEKKILTNNEHYNQESFLNFKSIDLLRFLKRINRYQIIIYDLIYSHFFALVELRVRH